MSFIDQIREAMTTDSRTSKELAAATGIHPVNLRHFKSGKRGLSPDALERLSAALGMEIQVKRIRKKSR